MEHKWFSFCCVFNFWLVIRLKSENDDRAWLIDWLVWMWATNGCEGNNNWIHFRHYLDKKKTNLVSCFIFSKRKTKKMRKKSAQNWMSKSNLHCFHFLFITVLKITEWNSNRFELDKKEHNFRINRSNRIHETNNRFE